MQSILSWDGWIPIILAVVAIVATWLITRAYGTRRARLELRVLANRLMARETPRGVGVTHDGTPVADPWLVQVQLANRGPRDITAENFHNREALALRLGVPVVVVLATTGKPIIRESGTTVEDEPFHLPRRAIMSFTCLVDGRPHLQVDPLVDTDVVQVKSSLDQEFIPGLFVGVLMGVGGLFGEVWQVLFGTRVRR